MVSFDVYVVSKSQLFERASLEKSVYRWSETMPPGRRQRPAVDIAEVCKADGEFNDMEAAYFNAMTESLRLAPSADCYCRLDRATGCEIPTRSL